MCGIAGFIQPADLAKGILSERCTQMTATLLHRGPDAGGVWVDESCGVALGHRRLSIIDLSDAGTQPMCSENGRYVISFNGEIYNFQRLRKGLEASRYPFRGHSDTEVILAAVEHYGAEKAIRELDGMFSIALWDRQSRDLLLARDRAGKKPLYYGWSGSTFMFASELKALRVHPAFNRDIDHDALGQYVQYGWLSQPNSIYRHIKKLPPGTLLKVEAGSVPWSASPLEFWSARQVMEEGRANRFTGSYTQAVDELERFVRDAVEDRMVADVDVGALLSGGIDSSLVVALMQQCADRPVKTFSIGFREEKYNEAQYAAAVARQLGTEHHELYVTPEQALDVVDLLPTIYDEPLADASEIPTYLVCKLAHEQVKVVLTGDGGDEQFAGYRRYKNCLQHWRAVNRVPNLFGSMFAGMTRQLGEQGWLVAGRLQPDAEKKVPNWLRKLGKYGQRSCNWQADYPQNVLANKFNKCLKANDFVKGASSPGTPLADPAYWAHVEDPLFAMLHYDYIGYLADDILVKVDRASMAVSLESRSPLLDQRVLEFAWTLPREFLFDGRNGKLVLRDLLIRHVPRGLIDRPKRGFSVPVKEWIIGELREWVEDLVSARTLDDQGIFDTKAVRAVWSQHLRGWANHSELMWSILMFQTWWRSQALVP